MEERIANAVHDAGIPLFGIVKPVRPAHFISFLNWLAAGYHAEMTYLSKRDSIDKRSEPIALLENTKAILVFGFPHPHPESVMQNQENGVWGQIAGYAACKDYHATIPEILVKLWPVLSDIAGKDFQYRIFTDSAPILERDMACSAGLGWIGKNGCLISPQIGSFFLLAEMFCDLDLQPSESLKNNYCGTCRRCIDACPTGCIHEDHSIDSRRCISYLTIENKASIPLTLRTAVGNRIFGCDVCQQVCPWNHKPAKLSPPDQLLIRGLPHWVNLATEAHLTENQFNARYADYPIMRAKRNGFLRNVVVSMGNAGRPDILPDLRAILESDPAPLVRAHAAWAIGQISGVYAEKILSSQLIVEQDHIVADEIMLALESR